MNQREKMLRASYLPFPAEEDPELLAAFQRSLSDLQGWLARFPQDEPVRARAAQLQSDLEVVRSLFTLARKEPVAASS